MFVVHVISFDTVLSTIIAIGSVLYCYSFGQHITMNMNMNFGMLSIGVVFPISLSISQAFARRESALPCALDASGLRHVLILCPPHVELGAWPCVASE